MANSWTGKQFNQNRAAHQTYAFAMDARNMKNGRVDAACIHCGGQLTTYYCEEELHIVRCLNCGIAALVQARSPKEAALKSIGREKQ